MMFWWNNFVDMMYGINELSYVGFCFYVYCDNEFLKVKCSFFFCLILVG